MFAPGTLCSLLDPASLHRGPLDAAWVDAGCTARCRPRSSADIFELMGASAPAEKMGGAPVTMTTFVAVSSRSSAKAAPRSVSMGSLSELRRSGRFRVTVAMTPSRSIFTFSMTADAITASRGLALSRDTAARREA